MSEVDQKLKTLGHYANSMRSIMRDVAAVRVEGCTAAQAVEVNRALTAANERLCEAEMWARGMVK